MITVLAKDLYKRNKINVGYEPVELDAGELIFGATKFANELNLRRNKVYRTIKLFEDDGMIEYDTESYEGEFSIIKVLNWREYQTIL